MNVEEAIQEFAQQWLDLHQKQIQQVHAYEEDWDVQMQKEHVQAAIDGRLDQLLDQEYDSASDQVYENNSYYAKEFIDNLWDVNQEDQQKLVQRFLQNVHQESESQWDDDELEEQLEEYVDDIKEKIQDMLREEYVDFYSVNVRLQGEGFIGSERISLSNLDVMRFEWLVPKEQAQALCTQLAAVLPDPFLTMDEHNDQAYVITIQLPLVSDAQSLQKEAGVDPEWQELCLLLQMEPKAFFERLQAQVQKAKQVLELVSDWSDPEEAGQTLQELSSWCTTLKPQKLDFKDPKQGGFTRAVSGYALQGCALDFQPLSDEYFERVCKLLNQLDVMDNQSMVLHMGAQIDGEDLQLIHNVYHSAHTQMVGFEPAQKVALQLDEPVLLASDSHGYETCQISLLQPVSVAWESLTEYEEDDLYEQSRLNVQGLESHMQLQKACGQWERHYWQSCVLGQHNLEQYLKKVQQQLGACTFLGPQALERTQRSWKKSLDTWLQEQSERSKPSEATEGLKGAPLAPAVVYERVLKTVQSCIDERIQKNKQDAYIAQQCRVLLEEKTSWNVVDEAVKKQVGFSQGLGADRQARRIVQMHELSEQKHTLLELQGAHEALYVDAFGQGLKRHTSKQALIDWIQGASAEALNQKDALGRTPLMLAAARGDTQLVGALIKAGADVFIKDHGGNDVAHYVLANIKVSFAQNEPCLKWQEHQWLEAFLAPKNTSGSEKLPTVLQNVRSLLTYCLPVLEQKNTLQSVAPYVRSESVWLVGCAIGAPLYWVNDTSLLKGRIGEQCKAIGEYLHLRSTLIQADQKQLKDSPMQSTEESDHKAHGAIKHMGRRL